MADSSPNLPKPPGSSPDHGPSSSRASVPPSEPRASRTSLSQIDAQADRPARLQMIVALVLGLVLVAIPLYLWRRPRAESIAVNQKDASVEPATSSAPPPDEKVTLTDAHVASCHDPGTKKTAPADCDRLLDVEKAFSTAITENASCVTKDVGGGTIAYIADVSFKKKSIGVVTPRDGRSIRSSKIVSACQSAVRDKLQSVNLETVTHQHQRYKIAITATYPASSKN